MQQQLFLRERLRVRETKLHTGTTKLLKHRGFLNQSVFQHSLHSYYIPPPGLCRRSLFASSLLRYAQTSSSKENYSLPLWLCPSSCHRISPEIISVDGSRLLSGGANFSCLKAFSQLAPHWGPFLTSDHNISQGSTFCCLANTFQIFSSPPPISIFTDVASLRDNRTLPPFHEVSLAAFSF